MSRLYPACLPVLLAGCADVPLGYLDHAGPTARMIARLGWGFIAISVAVSIIVGVLLVWAIGRPRVRRDETIVPVDDRTPIRWIVIGTGISAVFLLGSAIWTLGTVHAISALPTANALHVDVVGQEWWWEVRYHADDRARDFTTADQLVIPVGVPVRIELTSRDVIHSFWVPKLGGKMDMIPSRANVAWLQADAAGDYRGQCSEFCGLQHANMAFNVRALPPDDFQKWWDRQLQPPATAPADPGAKTFMVRCAVCHTIRGTAAGGILGPDLSHFGSRDTIAAGLLPNTPENLARWINNTQTIKPGAKMPELGMLASEIDDVARYLEDLK